MSDPETIHYTATITLDVEIDGDPMAAALEAWDVIVARWVRNGYRPFITIQGGPNGLTEVDLEIVDVTLEACVCGECTECPDGWHYGADLPCSCTPDCVDAVDPDDPEGPLLDENGAKQA